MDEIISLKCRFQPDKIIYFLNMYQILYKYCKTLTFQVWKFFKETFVIFKWIYFSIWVLAEFKINFGSILIYFSLRGVLNN